MYCRHCYRQIADGSQICPNCGKKPEIRVGFTGDAPDQNLMRDPVPPTPHPVPAPTAPNQPGYIYCSRCGEMLSATSTFCNRCGMATQPQRVDVQYVVMQQAAERPTSSTKCRRCGGHNVQYSTVVEGKSAGCLTVILYFLLAITVVGLLVVIPLMLRKKTKTVTYAVCQDCGHRWRSA